MGRRIIRLVESQPELNHSVGADPKPESRFLRFALAGTTSLVRASNILGVTTPPTCFRTTTLRGPESKSGSPCRWLLPLATPRPREKGPKLHEEHFLFLDCCFILMPGLHWRSGFERTRTARQCVLPGHPQSMPPGRL